MFIDRSVVASTEHSGRATGSSPELDRLRLLAGQGLLQATVSSATRAERAALTRAAYDLAWPVVFARLTRSVEMQRGHFDCAVGVVRLADPCLDGFHDDVEAAVMDLLGNADKPITNVEGWIASRLQAATVDAFRRRRGERGALQRPRTPQWLARALREDPWLVDLAVQILVWVGSPTTAGVNLWPLDSWAARRATITRDWAGSDTIAVRREVDQVLAAMRQHPGWYADYVERPLGRKQAPTATPTTDEDGRTAELTPLLLTDPDDLLDRHLLDLAENALTRMRGRLRRGEPPAVAIPDVIRQVFTDELEGRDIDQLPHTTPSGKHEAFVAALLDDPADVQRMVATALEILRTTDPLGAVVAVSAAPTRSAVLRRSTSHWVDFPAAS